MAKDRRLCLHSTSKDCWYHEQNGSFRAKSTWIPVPGLWFSSCAAVSKSLNVPEPPLSRNANVEDDAEWC